MHLPFRRGSRKFQKRNQISPTGDLDNVALEFSHQRLAIRQGRLEPLALSALGHENVVNGRAAASREEKFDLSAGIAWVGDILK